MNSSVIASFASWLAATTSQPLKLSNELKLGLFLSLLCVLIHAIHL